VKIVLLARGGSNPGANASMVAEFASGLLRPRIKSGLLAMTGLIRRVIATHVRNSTMGMSVSKTRLEEEASPSSLIDARIAELADWRGETLARVRALIKEADPDIAETWKWRGVPVWEHEGIICTGETYKAVVKLTFAKGAALADPKNLFNSSLDGNVRRAIDIREGEAIDAAAFKALIQAAVAVNTGGRKKRRG
jgi:hypothetical protein